MQKIPQKPTTKQKKKTYDYTDLLFQQAKPLIKICQKHRNKKLENKIEQYMKKYYPNFRYILDGYFGLGCKSTKIPLFYRIIFFLCFDKKQVCVSILIPIDTEINRAKSLLDIDMDLDVLPTFHKFMIDYLTNPKRKILPNTIL